MNIEGYIYSPTSGGGYAGYYEALTDSNSSPSTLVSAGATNGNSTVGGDFCPISFTVKKNNYYAVSLTGVDGTPSIVINAIPIGS